MIGARGYSTLEGIIKAEQINEGQVSDEQLKLPALGNHRESRNDQASTKLDLKTGRDRVHALHHHSSVGNQSILVFDDEEMSKIQQAGVNAGTIGLAPEVDCRIEQPHKISIRLGGRASQLSQSKGTDKLIRAAGSSTDHPSHGELDDSILSYVQLKQQRVARAESKMTVSVETNSARETTNLP